MTPDQQTLAARTLRVPLPEWQAIVREVEGRTGAERLACLERAFARRRPREAIPAGAAAATCPACAGNCEPFMVASPALVYGRCTCCGHGLLLSGGRADDVYAGEAYFRVKTADGVGYDDCASEREYRTAKGRRLVETMMAEHGARPKRLLEVGCGLGFTLAAASRLGLDTFGVDVNPAARATFTGTLAGALARGAAPMSDLVLYQFVLEHVPDVVAELRAVAAALTATGLAAFIVPSMEATEIDVFAGAYRSFRADHVHLFTARSITRLCEHARLRVTRIESTCNLHLLAAALNAHELEQLYRSGRGPDLTVHVRRTHA